MRKIISRTLGALLGLVAVAILAAVLYPAPSYEPPPRDHRDESAYRLEEMCGWYRLEDGTERLLTRGAEHGLIMYRFGSRRDDLERMRFIAASDDTLVSSDPDRSDRLELVRGDGGIEARARLTIHGRGQQPILRTTGVGYETREVRYRNGPVELTGLLFVPDGPGPHPGAAFIHGSGVSDRDNFWYLTPADFLARRGLMVLLPDKRGCGRSGGQWHTASFEDFAVDALAAVAELAEQPSVDSGAIGLVGFSQGGWIAPLAASRSGNIAFVVTVSASTETPYELLRYEVRHEISDSGAPGIVADVLAPLFARRAKMKRRLWWQLNGPFDPMEHWRSVDVPVLMIFGEEDHNVDVARSLERLQGAGLLDRAGFEVLVLPGLAHGLIRPDTGWVDEQYLETLVRFVRTPAGPASAVS